MAKEQQDYKQEGYEIYTDSMLGCTMACWE